MNQFHIPFVWESRAPAALEKCIYVPDHYQGHERFQVPWDELFEKTQKVLVEYCSGNGQWIVDQAKKSPLINWIAVERDFHRARKIWFKINRQDLKNLIVVYGEALTFSRYYLADKSIDGAFVNFPDPWPKRRHAKHRLIQEAFVQELGRILCPNAAATIVTDDPAYSDWIVKKFLAWKSAFFPLNYVTEWPEFGDSYFHSLWLSQKRSIRFHRFYTARDSKIGSAFVSLPLNLIPPASLELLKLGCFGAGQA